MAAAGQRGGRAGVIERQVGQVGPARSDVLGCGLPAPPRQQKFPLCGAADDRRAKPSAVAGKGKAGRLETPPAACLAFFAVGMRAGLLALPPPRLPHLIDELRERLLHCRLWPSLRSCIRGFI